MFYRVVPVATATLPRRLMKVVHGLGPEAVCLRLEAIHGGLPFVSFACLFLMMVSSFR